MFASSCINPEIPFLQPEDKGLTALSLFEELKVSEIPLVGSDDLYIGLIREIDLLDYDFADGKLSDLKAELKRPFIYEDDHLFDVVGLMGVESLTVLPVLTRQEKYVGSIDQTEVIKNISLAEGYIAIGGVLELEMTADEYSMAELSRIVESMDAKIIYSYITSSPDSKNIQVTLKLNKSNLTTVMRNLERYGYTITASFQQDEYKEDLRRRYEGFLRYLNT